MMQPLRKNVWKFLKKLKIELSYDPAIPLLGIYPEKTKTLIQKDTCAPMFIAALFTWTEKDKYHDITDFWNLKKMIQMNLFTKQK